MEKMIFTRSPFFVQFASAQQTVFCDVKIWVGDKVSDKPASITYALNKEVTSGAATFEIAELMRDFLSHSSTLTSGFAWAEVTLSDGVAVNSVNTYFVTEGYTLYDEGLQHNSTASSSERVCVTSDNVYAVEGQTVSIPVYVNGNLALYSYEKFNLAGVGQGSVNFSSSNLSNNQIKYVVVNENDSKVVFNFNGVSKTIFVNTFRCSKFDPLLITYVNKFGAKAQQWFTLLSKESLASSSDTFQRSLVDYAGLNNGNQLHAFRKRITGSKQSFTLNADYVQESDVESFEELFLSEYVWLIEGANNPIPVNLNSNSMEKKKHVNDKLINYSFNVETASNYINTVR